MTDFDPTAERAHHRLAATLAGIDIDDFVTPRSCEAVLNGLRLHYLDWGMDGKPSILLLHGGGQTARTWDLVALALRREYRCLALDQRGHGDSEWSYGFAYGPEDHAGDILALLDDLEIERVIVVGMSMGCINGLHFAAHHSERVAAFVAVDAGPWVQMDGGQRIIDFVAESSQNAVLLEEWVERALRFNPRRDPRLLRRSLLHNLRRLPDGALMLKTDRRRPIDTGEMAVRLQALRQDVHRVTCPTLVVRGGDSDVLSDEDAERFARALHDGRWIRIAGAGHTVQGDQPAQLVRAVRAFLAQCAESAGSRLRCETDC